MVPVARHIEPSYPGWESLDLIDQGCKAPYRGSRLELEVEKGSRSVWTYLLALGLHLFVTSHGSHVVAVGGGPIAEAEGTMVDGSAVWIERRNDATGDVRKTGDKTRRWRGAGTR